MNGDFLPSVQFLKVFNNRNIPEEMKTCFGHSFKRIYDINYYSLGQGFPPRVSSIFQVLNL
ncbi:hypothetical protein Avbf_12532 [Armadillidium vulgare]|nr:hypothetical protein Avbf_12532 [Armadillidium vulgare]